MDSLAYEIITTRYPRKTNVNIENYLIQFGTTDSIDFLINRLKQLINEPIKWNGYTIPDSINVNKEFFKKEAFKLIEEFQKQKTYTNEDVSNFFFKNHVIIKYAIQRWLFINPGIALELFKITEDNLDQKTLEFLQFKKVQVGDELLHIHIVSTVERDMLVKLNYRVPYIHWDKSYYIEALQVVNKMLQSNPKSIGVFCEHSWVFDPAIHNIASDGRPFVSFDFLKDDKLVGERFFVSDAKSDNKYAKQFEFAVRNERRLKLFEQKEFFPKTYGIFYVKESLNKFLNSSVNQ